MPADMAADQDHEIILFDLANRFNKCISLNPWKTRFVLNYKGLPYRTEWLDYPQMEPRLAPHVAPAPAGSPAKYTVPTVAYNDPGRTYIMDSAAIAERIERDHPQPPLRLDSPYLRRVADALAADIMPGARGNYIPQVPVRLLNPVSLPHWYATREAAVGMPLDELERTEAGFAGIAGALQRVTAWLKENGDGPFFDGEAVGYADFVWGGFLIFFRWIGEDKFGELLEASGDAEPHLRLLRALEPWSKRDD